jgi:two-component system, OmpR family, alkaline phosphatase synthesis response regulator PhoP
MKVLVVENNAELLKLLTHLLEKEGFSVSSATAGNEAIALHMQRRPAIICLDVMLDDISGFDVCRSVRKTDKDVQIIMITSKSRQVDINAGIEAGADDYIIKPFDLAAITAHMRNVARMVIARDQPAAINEVLHFGPGLSIFPGRLCAERDGETIDLSFRDIAFLKTFYANRGKTLPTAVLKEHCWSASPEPEVATVDWHIKQLRRKMEIDPANPALIKSDQGGGYRFG